MKKKLILVVTLCLISASILTSCGNKSTTAIQKSSNEVLDNSNSKTDSSDESTESDKSKSSNKSKETAQSLIFKQKGEKVNEILKNNKFNISNVRLENADGDIQGTAKINDGDVTFSYSYGRADIGSQTAFEINVDIKQPTSKNFSPENLNYLTDTVKYVTELADYDSEGLRTQLNDMMNILRGKSGATPTGRTEVLGKYIESIKYNYDYNDRSWIEYKYRLTYHR